MSKKNINLTDGKGAGYASPSARAVAITPSDTTDLPEIARLYVGGAGDLVVVLANNENDEAVTLSAAPVGYHPLLVRRVLATGTTATNIVALFME